MRTKSSVCLATLLFTLAAGAAGAADLPKSGKFTIHSGWKGIGETIEVAKDHSFWYGSFWGVTYNDAGEGLLHMGAAACSGTLELISGAGRGQGSCAWGDADGDKILNDWSGSLTPAGEFSGVNQFTGGTGKFNGIQGKAPFQCKALNANGQWACTQQFEYRVP